VFLMAKEVIFHRYGVLVSSVVIDRYNGGNFSALAMCVNDVIGSD